MKRATLLCALCIILAFSASDLSASGVDLTGVGARAQAMGGNYRSIANDWSAMYWNPAGLAFTKGLGVGASFEFVMPTSSFTVGNSQYGNLTGQNWPFSAAYRNERTNEPQTFFLPAAGITYNFGKLAVGVGVWAPFGLGSKWDILRTANNNLNNIPGKRFDTYSTQYPNIEYESNLQIIDIHPTIAYKISDKLSVGAGASIILGDIFMRKPVYIQNPFLYNPNIYYALLAVAQVPEFMLRDMIRSPFDHLLTQAEMDGSGNGFGANFGLMFKPTKNLSIGATVQWYNDVSMDGQFENTFYFPDVPDYTDITKAFADSAFKGGMVTPDQYFILANYYSGLIQSEGEKEVKADLPLPLKAGLGISYSGIRNLLLSADVAYSQWSAWDQILITGANGETVATLDQNWQDALRLGLGFELTAGAAKIRGGFYSEGPAAVDETLTVAIPDINRRNVVTFGVQIPAGPVSISLNYEKLFIADKEVKTWAYDASTTAKNLAGLYTMNVNNLMLGLDFQF
ncbi:MAG: hypothetical protein EHM72_04985 [Calditrichaeota bacterium]|nr:MAG: hypothetical protein EHM72_04985 [Calditrichota bacterium]